MELFIIKDDCSREVVDRIAQVAGFRPGEIHTALNAEEARVLMDEMVPDLAVVDPHLTENEELEDGITLIAELHRRFRKCCIICLTMSGTNAVGSRAIDSGAHDFINVSWPRINWTELLIQRLLLWRAVLERDATEKEL